MPEQTHPPYVLGSTTIPRTLNRWLDINPQNGPLYRTSTFITLPAFIQASSSWNGYSDIVESFNFESPNALSLVGIQSDIPLAPNYALCISYQTQGIVTRYLVWDAIDSNLNQELEYYTGQPIKKNFRFEIWNTSQGAASQATNIVFVTSKKGNVDYRWGIDTALSNSDTPCIDFNADIGSYFLEGTGGGTPGISGNGHYTGVVNGKNAFANDALPNNTIQWDGSQWIVDIDLGGGHHAYYTSSDDVATPDLATFIASSGATNPPPAFVLVSTSGSLPLIFPSDSISTTN